MSSTIVVVAALVVAVVFYGVASVGGTPVSEQNPYRWDGSANITLVFDDVESYSQVCVIRPDGGRDEEIYAPKNRIGGIQSTWQAPWFEGSATVYCDQARVFIGGWERLAMSYNTPLIVIPPILLVRFILWARRQNRNGMFDQAQMFRT